MLKWSKFVNKTQPEVKLMLMIHSFGVRDLKKCCFSFQNTLCKVNRRLIIMILIIIITWYIYMSNEANLFLFSDEICQYFGVKIAMYFAWLGMYTKWLVAPAILGIITFFLSNRGEATRDWCIFFFNIFNIVWATLFLEAWKRKSAELAYKWGTMDMPSDALKEPRPLFRVSSLTF